MAGMAGIEPAMRESKSRALTAWLHPTMEESAGPEPPLRPCRLVSGVGDGTRTHDTRNHNPMLYQLNYAHHIQKGDKRNRDKEATGQEKVQSEETRLQIGVSGTPGGTRTPGPLLRRQLLYPPELQARIETPPWQGRPRKRLSPWSG